MGINTMIGKSWRQTLDNNQYLDISIYPNKWFTKVKMDLWERGNGIALSFNEKNHINFNKFMPLKLAEKLATYLINKQSQEVAGFDLLTKVGD